jgi:ABC-type transporter Mla subunit MlaD
MPLLFLIGCGKAPEATAAAAKATASDPEQELYEKVKTARYQIGVATDRLAEIVNVTRGLAMAEEAEVREALNRIADDLASAGSKIADFDEEPPALAQFKAEFSEQDEARLKAIEACNAALANVASAAGLTEELLASGPPEEAKNALTQVRGSITEAQDALEEAVTGMDGVVR